MSRSNLFRVEVEETFDDGGVQMARAAGYSSEQFGRVPVLRQHGLASHAPKGSHGYGLAGSGERSQVTLLGLEHPDKRPRQLKEGQTVLYDATGNATRMLGDDGVWHDAGARPQKLTGKTITLTGSDRVEVVVGDTRVIVTAGRVDLGGEGGSPVMTEAGASSKVFAVL